MRARKNRGMTLIEVLVAFVILSLAMGVIMQIFFGGMRYSWPSQSWLRWVSSSPLWQVMPTVSWVLICVGASPSTLTTMVARLIGF